MEEHASSTSLRKAKFNLQLSSYAHSSWLGPQLAGLDEPVWRRSRAVSRWLAQRVGVSTVFDWRMKESAKRLFLMDVADLGTVSLDLGVALQRDRFAREVRRQSVIAHRDAFGEERLAFAFDGVPRGMPCVPIEAQPDDIDPAALRSQAFRLGAQTLWRLLDRDWVAVRQRAALMFDQSWQLDASVEPFARGSRRAMLALVMDVLIPKRVPQCAWLF